MNPTTRDQINTILEQYQHETIDHLRAEGYFIIAPSALPEVSEGFEGKPKLPPRWGEQPYNSHRPEKDVFYEEALGKLALVRFHERRAEVLAKRTAALVRDIGDVPSRTNFETDAALAAHLVEKGWKR